MHCYFVYLVDGGRLPDVAFLSLQHRDLAIRRNLSQTAESTKDRA